MSKLADKIKQVKAKIKPYENDLILIIVIILIALISFGLGRLSKIREGKTSITVESVVSNISSAVEVGNSETNPNPSTLNVGANEKMYVASKSGTKYHYPWCPGALNIKEENKIWFSTKEEAEKAGYSPAANCKGL